jgi:uncharacterized membrane protein
MEDVFKNKAEHVRHITLTESERALVFQKISSHMRSGLHTLNTTTSLQWFMFLHKTAVALGVFIFVFSGAAVVVASQDSLPGDLLYPVKVNIKEPVVSAVSFGTHAKIYAEVQKADERLKEAEKLSEEGRLNAVTRKEIEVRFETHVEKVDAFTNVDTESTDIEIEKRVKTREDLEERVVEHVDKLDKVKEVLSDEKKEEIEKFKYNVLNTVLDKKNKGKFEGKGR